MRRFFGTEEFTGATPNALKDKLFIVSVRTVEKDEKQRRLRKEERYSVIDKIVDYVEQFQLYSPRVIASYLEVISKNAPE